MSLIARYLEAAAIPTVIMGCAKDIVEHAGVPRFLFSDFPLGNSAGKPHNALSQQQTLQRALALFDTATRARTTTINPEVWADDEQWKADFMNIDKLSEPQIARLKAAFVEQKRTAQEIVAKGL